MPAAKLAEKMLGSCVGRHPQEGREDLAASSDHLSSLVILTLAEGVGSHFCHQHAFQVKHGA